MYYRRKGDIATLEKLKRLIANGDCDPRYHYDPDELNNIIKYITLQKIQSYIIVYDREESGFVEQAKWMAKYAFNNINVILLYVSTTKEFIDKWNLLPDRIESLHIFLHGGPGVLYFQDGELSTKDLYSLEKKEINGKAYLFYYENK